MRYVPNQLFSLNIFVRYSGLTIVLACLLSLAVPAAHAQANLPVGLVTNFTNEVVDVYASSIRGSLNNGNSLVGLSAVPRTFSDGAPDSSKFTELTHAMVSSAGGGMLIYKVTPMTADETSIHRPSSYTTLFPTSCSSATGFFLEQLQYPLLTAPTNPTAQLWECAENWTGGNTTYWFFWGSPSSNQTVYSQIQ